MLCPCSRSISKLSFHVFAEVKKPEDAAVAEKAEASKDKAESLPASS